MIKKPAKGIQLGIIREIATIRDCWVVNFSGMKACPMHWHLRSAARAAAFVNHMRQRKRNLHNVQMALGLKYHGSNCSISTFLCMPSPCVRRGFFRVWSCFTKPPPLGKTTAGAEVIYFVLANSSSLSEWPAAAIGAMLSFSPQISTQCSPLHAKLSNWTLYAFPGHSSKWLEFRMT